MARLTFNKVNAALAAAGYPEKLVQGRGYLYFIEGNAHCWYSSSIPVCWLNHLDSVEEVIEFRNELANSHLNSW